VDLLKRGKNMTPIVKIVDIDNVSGEDAEMFINLLNKITGEKLNINKMSFDNNMCSWMGNQEKLDGLVTEIMDSLVPIFKNRNVPPQIAITAMLHGINSIAHHAIGTGGEDCMEPEEAKKFIIDIMAAAINDVKNMNCEVLVNEENELNAKRGTTEKNDKKD
jgi:hypothetical protein